MTFGLRMTLAFCALGALLLASTFEYRGKESTQQGFRGTGMVQITGVDRLREYAAANRIPEALPDMGSDGPTAGEVYENVQVLADMPDGEFIRLMTAITEWVSPVEGCAYCHDEANLASDDKYTKIVSRRMIEMTRHINEEWPDHVAQTGVTCYTCHRGNPVPENIWFDDPAPRQAGGMAARRGTQNVASPVVGYTSLPHDPYARFLAEDVDGATPDEIRVVSQTALPETPGASIQMTERTYGLMMHLSDSLGVNCTFCHNTRSFAAWEESSPVRTTAFHGIRMVRDLNAAFLEPLVSEYPHERLGILGDAPKASCATCHQGVSKPLLGASMLQDYPWLGPMGDMPAEAGN